MITVTSSVQPLSNTSYSGGPNTSTVPHYKFYYTFIFITS